MKKKHVILIALYCMILSGCQEAENPPSAENTAKEVISKEMAWEANEEYDTVEEFLESSERPAFLLENRQRNQMTATPSEAGVQFQISGENVSVGEHYVAVNYECTVDGAGFMLQLGTYSFSDGEESMRQILERSPGLFSEKEIHGQKVYYCPGSEYEPYNYYLMVLDGKMFVLNIEQGYDQYVEMLMECLESR